MREFDSRFLINLTRVGTAGLACRDAWFVLSISYDTVLVVGVALSCPRWSMLRIEQCIT